MLVQTRNNSPDELDLLNSILPGFKTEGLKVSHYENHTYFEAPAIMPESYYGWCIDFFYQINNYYQGLEKVLDAENVFRGKTVIDLGAGKESWAFYQVLRAGASAYIAVEPLTENVECLSYSVKSVARMQTAVVKEDIESFLTRLPDASACYIMSALSPELHTERPKSFFASVSDEIARTIAPNGAILWYQSDEKLLPEKVARQVIAAERGPLIYLHEKERIIPPNCLI